MPCAEADIMNLICSDTAGFAINWFIKSFGKQFCYVLSKPQNWLSVFHRQTGRFLRWNTDRQ